MKTIRVVAAVICDSMQAKRKIYATARGYGDYKGQWVMRLFCVMYLYKSL